MGQGLGLGMRTNYREMRTKSINGNKRVARGDKDISKVCEGLDVMTELHTVYCDMARSGS